MMICSNSIAPGSHAGSLTLPAGAVSAVPQLLGAYNPSTGRIDLCSATAMPFGLIADSPESIGEPVCVQLLGSAACTLRMTLAADVTAGSPLYTAANGRVTPASAAGCYQVGLALSSGSAGQSVEVDPCLPRLIQ